MLDSKLILPYMDDDGNIRGETVLAMKEGDYYRIKSIPLHALKIALYDLIVVRNSKGVLYFHEIMEDSGRSVIQLIVLKQRQGIAIGKALERFGCLWQKSKDGRRFAFDIPKHSSYSPIKNWLDEGQREQRWGYREACLSASHQSADQRPVG